MEKSLKQLIAEMDAIEMDASIQEAGNPLADKVAQAMALLQEVQRELAAPAGAAAAPAQQGTVSSRG